MNLERLSVPVFPKVKRMRDISIDIETLGTRYDAPVVSIGAQAFDINTGKLGQDFYTVIDMASALRSGRVSAETLRFWLQQNDEARHVFAKRESNLDLATALLNFTTWVRTFPSDVRVWGNGATFDITILEHAYTVGSVGLKEGWHFRNVRDMRTLIDVSEFDVTTVPAVGTAHNALDDAKFQAKCIAAAWQKVRAAMAGEAKAAQIAQAQAVAEDDDPDAL